MYSLEVTCRDRGEYLNGKPGSKMWRSCCVGNVFATRQMSMLVRRCLSLRRDIVALMESVGSCVNSSSLWTWIGVDAGALSQPSQGVSDIEDAVSSTDRDSTELWS